MMRKKAATCALAAVLISSLLLLNFSVVTYRVTAVAGENRVTRGEHANAQKAQISFLVHEETDSQDPETTACRCAFLQVVRLNQPVPALLSLAGALPFCLNTWTLSRPSALAGFHVRRNAERIAEFLHDLAAAL